jgi:hypothetical protein
MVIALSQLVIGQITLATASPVEPAFALAEPGASVIAAERVPRLLVAFLSWIASRVTQVANNWSLSSRKGQIYY